MLQMTSHIYWTVPCKTEGCSRHIEVEYLGEFMSISSFQMPFWGLPIEFSCSGCGKSNLYSSAS